MIIPENREKVKRKAQSLISKLSSQVTKPEFKFILEMVLGIVTTGSSNLSEIARVLEERKKIKIYKRNQRSTCIIQRKNR